MNPIIQEILEKGIKVQIVFNTETQKNEYIIDGFYKSGTITLFENQHDLLMAFARYGELTLITKFDDLVDLNHSWWIASAPRYEGWASPDPQWLPYLLEKGLVTEEKKTIYKSTTQS
jgi:hypothetical protein